MPLPTRRPRRDDGFTLIEILVVILIVSILTAIALPSFLRERNRGHDSRAKSDVRNVVAQIDSCFTEHEDYRKCDTGVELGKIGVDLGTGTNQARIVTTGPTAFQVRELSSSGNTFVARRETDGSTVFTCSVPDGNSRGGCANNGGW